MVSTAEQRSNRASDIDEKIVADSLGFDQKVIMVERVDDKGDFRAIVSVFIQSISSYYLPGLDVPGAAVTVLATQSPAQTGRPFNFPIGTHCFGFSSGRPPLSGPEPVPDEVGAFLVFGAGFTG